MRSMLMCAVWAFAIAGCVTRTGTQCECAPATVAPAPAPLVHVSSPAPAPVRVAATARPASLDRFRALDTLKDAHFASGKTDVLWADNAVLGTVVAWLKQNPTGRVLIEGYSDDRGTKEQKLATAERRAKSVMQRLVSQGVAAERITTVSYGSDRPVCTEKTEVCRAKNRRVHFLVKER